MSYVIKQRCGSWLEMNNDSNSKRWRGVPSLERDSNDGTAGTSRELPNMLVVAISS